MQFSIDLKNGIGTRLRPWLSRLATPWGVGVLATLLAMGATTFFYFQDTIVAYGDAESHLNIAKRVVDSLTPGAAQLGGIWLPLPHVLLAPLVYFDFLWRSGLAGSMISGVAFVVAAIFLFKIVKLLTGSRGAAFIGALVFVLNPNLLYLQSTPMTELPLIAFFVLSTYFFLRYLREQENILPLVASAFFGFCAALSRYDGWFLVAIEAGILFLISFPYTVDWKVFSRPLGFATLHGFFVRRENLYGESRKGLFQKLEGRVVLFATLAFFGIVLWLVWDALILGDPLYFTHSQFSASSQQQGWLARGELPAYHDLWQSFLYYFFTALGNAGVLVFAAALVGLGMYLFRGQGKHRALTALLLFTPFVFYVATLYMGQSVIFIPHITPPDFEWTLFNVRYGVIMIPAVATLFGYLFFKSRSVGKIALVILIAAQFGLYGVGYSKVLSFEDGVRGLSSAKPRDAERFMQQNYDEGLVLLDDFSRPMSIPRSGIPMRNIIYIGNKPYWEGSLREPEKYATWIVTQKDDQIWKSVYEPPEMQGRLFKYFTKVYTSPEILIFKKTSALILSD
ncbi:MAG: Glycosyl transferase family 2 [Parcubacteria group bacterium GW2011_GWA2_51_12]|nr:MAG: Glycosyl transferase family 2 [Parcubacteria group bacterium GW2011_GWA2_51_12]